MLLCSSCATPPWRASVTLVPHCCCATRNYTAAAAHHSSSTAPTLPAHSSSTAAAALDSSSSTTRKQQQQQHTTAAAAAHHSSSSSTPQQQQQHTTARLVLHPSWVLLAPAHMGHGGSIGHTAMGQHRHRPYRHGAAQAQAIPPWGSTGTGHTAMGQHRHRPYRHTVQQQLQHPLPAILPARLGLRAGPVSAMLC